MRGKVARIIRKMTDFIPSASRKYVAVGTGVGKEVQPEPNPETGMLERKFIEMTTIQMGTNERTVYLAAKMSYKDMDKKGK